jgi:hypothetical protein
MCRVRCLYDVWMRVCVCMCLDMYSCMFSLTYTHSLTHTHTLTLQYRRRKVNLGTLWDESFSYVLSPSLSSYEHQRLYGETFGAKDFQTGMCVCMRYICKCAW